MNFTDHEHFMEVLQELMPFPSNLEIPPGSFEKNELVDLLTDHYEIEKTPLKIDFDLTMRVDFEWSELPQFYSDIFSSIELVGEVIAYPLYLKSGATAVTFAAADLYKYLLEDSFELTRGYELVDMARQDIVFIFIDQSVIVSIDHTAPSYIARINKKITPGADLLRPTLLWSKVWLWSVRYFEGWIDLEKGTYLLRYDPADSSQQLSEFSATVNELLGFYAEDPLGKKYPVIVENVSLQTCMRLGDLLNNSGIQTVIEERSDFRKTVHLFNPRDKPDIIIEEYPEP